MADPTFRSGTDHANFIRWTFIAGIIMTLVSIASDIAQLELLQRLRDGADWIDAEIEANDQRVSLVTLVDLLVFLIGAVVFLSWLRLARANLPALGIENARWGPGWAIGWWFVPVMNFFRPYQIVKEIWQASGPEVDQKLWRSAAAPSLLGWWWALYIMSYSVAFFANRAAREGEDIRTLIASSMLYMFANVLWVAATIAAIMIVKEIDHRQTARHLALTQGAERAVPIVDRRG